MSVSGTKLIFKQVDYKPDNTFFEYDESLVSIPQAKLDFDIYGTEDDIEGFFAEIFETKTNQRVWRSCYLKEESKLIEEVSRVTTFLTDTFGFGSEKLDHDRYDYYNKIRRLLPLGRG